MRFLVDNALSPLVALLLANLSAITDPLSKGAVVVLQENRVRIRPLPIFGVSQP